MKISQEGLSLIKKFEGCELEAYRCAANVLTIGYGSTKGVKEGDTITQEEADSLLLHEMDEYEGYINDMVKPDLKQNESLSLQHIRKYESDATGGYNAVNQGGAEGGTKVLGYYGPFGGHEKHKGRELTNLTLAEIQALQDDTGYAYDEPGWQRWYNDGKLNAVGAYQFNKPTLSDLIEKSKLPPYTKFTPAVQDYLGIMLLRERGVQPWVGPFNKANPQE